MLVGAAKSMTIYKEQVLNTNMRNRLAGHIERNEVQSKHPRERTLCEHRLYVAIHCIFFTRYLSRGSFDKLRMTMLEADVAVIYR